MEQEQTYVYLCENSLEGIFTAVYTAYEERRGHEHNRLAIAEGYYYQELMTSYIMVTTDYDKAVKVARTIQYKISWELYDFIQRASLSEDPRKADAIYRVIILALKMGGRVMDHLTEPNVRLLMEMERSTNYEISRFIQFLRFEELKNGFLFARINPKFAILPYLAEHFSDRFSGENWVIVDTVHGGVLVHERERKCSLATVQDIDFDAFTPEYSEDEAQWQKLWKMFVDTIAIKERVNAKLQMQMLPLRCRKYMKEFQQ